MSNFGTGQNLFGAATNQNKDQNPSNPASTPAAGGGLFGNLGANTTSSTAFGGGGGAGGAPGGGTGAPGPGTSGAFSGAGGSIFGGGANANASNPAGAGSNASPFGFAKPTTTGGSIFGSGPSGPSSTNATGPTSGGPGLFSGLGSQPKPSDAPASSASPFSLPGGSLFSKAPGMGTTATTTTANTQQPQTAFSLGGATTTGDKTAPAAAPASQCSSFLTTASTKHKGTQQVAGSLRASVSLQIKTESPRKRKTARLVSLEVAIYILTDIVSQHQPCPHSPLEGNPQVQQQPLQRPQQRKRTLQLPHVGGFYVYDALSLVDTAKHCFQDWEVLLRVLPSPRLHQRGLLHVRLSCQAVSTPLIID